MRVLSVVEPIPPPAAELWIDARGSLDQAEREMRSRATRLSKNSAEKLKRKGLRVESAVRSGDPRWEIVDEAEKWAADLIGMGSHGYTGIKRLFLGSVASWVVSHAPCSVEVVRKKRIRSES